MKSTIVFVLTCIWLLVACRDQAEKSSSDFDVKTIYEDHPGKEAIRIHCMTCHSQKYIETQPQFPRKTWEKIVDKMIHSFGAPIPDSSAKAIVDYLSGENS